MIECVDGGLVGEEADAVDDLAEALPADDEARGAGVGDADSARDFGVDPEGMAGDEGEEAREVAAGGAGGDFREELAVEVPRRAGDGEPSGTNAPLM